MMNEAHCNQRQRALRRTGAKAELLTGIAGVNSRPVRKIVLRAE